MKIIFWVNHKPSHEYRRKNQKIIGKQLITEENNGEQKEEITSTSISKSVNQTILPSYSVIQCPKSYCQW